MKKLIFAIFLLFPTLLNFAQTATDFTAADCKGTVHNLFSELNENNVIVLVWIMPCGGCAGPSKTTYNVIQKFQDTHHPNVFMYLIDDYGNTPCTSINSWSTSNGMPNTIRFSNSNILMSDYGEYGMPKIVVVGGGYEHKVYYNTNNYVNATELENAINAAMTTSDVNESGNTESNIKIYPNPSNSTTEIKFNLIKSAEVNIEMIDIKGNLVKNVFSGRLDSGDHSKIIDVKNISSGTYYIKFSDGEIMKTHCFYITR
jgi:hypothetical protein